MAISTGATLPADKELMTLVDGKPTGVKVGDVFSGKKVVMFTIPGALTPTCSDEHAPAYVANVADLKAKGVDEVVCLAVNDPFVMDVYAKKVDAGKTITFLTDGDASFIKDLGMDFDTGAFGGVRAVRASYIVDDGKVTHANLEDGGAYAGPSKVDTVMGQL